MMLKNHTNPTAHEYISEKSCCMIRGTYIKQVEILLNHSKTKEVIQVCGVQNLGHKDHMIGWRVGLIRWSLIKGCVHDLQGKR